jgi:hypothetical protein
MYDVEAAARDVRCWPAFISAGVDGAAAFAFVCAAAHQFPDLVAGVGAPVLDPLLERPGFVDSWRRADDATLRRQLGFRLALLHLIEASEVDPTTANAVAADLVEWSSLLAHRLGAADLFAAPAQIYGEAWRKVLSARIRAATQAVDVAVVAHALPAPPEEHAALALASTDPIAIYAGIDDDARWDALAHHADCMTGDAWRVARGRLAAFVLLSRSGRVAPPTLVQPAALVFSSGFPEDPSELVLEALAQLPEDARVELLISAPFRWKYAACSNHAQVIAAAVAAIDTVCEPGPDKTWAIRAFDAWGAAGRAALGRSASSIALEIATALTAYSQRRPRTRELIGLSASLQRAIAAAMDSLDADPAAWPPRRVQFPVLDFGEHADSVSWMVDGSWATVEAFAKIDNLPMLTAEIRRVSRAALSPRPVTTRGVDPRTTRMLIALARMVLPVWDSIHPGDDRPHRVVEDATRILGGAKPEHLEARVELHTYAYADDANRAAACVALTAVWAHSAALDDGDNDVQDTPPDLAVQAFTALDTNGATYTERARTFWERFFLDVIPSTAAPM